MAGVKLARSSFALDTSGMIAAVCTWHEHHEVVAAEIEERLARGERMTIAAPALVESYAVLTRLPAPHRLAPADAWMVIESSFARNAKVVALTGEVYVELLVRLAKESVAGGRTYDAVIGECARRANSAALLTLNRKDFDPGPEGFSVVDPSRT